MTPVILWTAALVGWAVGLTIIADPEDPRPWTSADAWQPPLLGFGYFNAALAVCAILRGTGWIP